VITSEASDSGKQLRNTKQRLTQMKAITRSLCETFKKLGEHKE
jgi:hypothetical protein